MGPTRTLCSLLQYPLSAIALSSNNIEDSAKIKFAQLSSLSQIFDLGRGPRPCSHGQPLRPSLLPPPPTFRTSSFDPPFVFVVAPPSCLNWSSKFSWPLSIEPSTRCPSVPRILCFIPDIHFNCKGNMTDF